LFLSKKSKDKEANLWHSLITENSILETDALWSRTLGGIYRRLL